MLDYFAGQIKHFTDFELNSSKGQAEQKAYRGGTSLLWRSAWRYAMQRKWQTGLNILGIMMGVMMVVSVDLANSSARQAFDASLELLNGSISHQVVGGSDGVPDTLFTRLKTELGLRQAAPTISGSVRINGMEITLIGLDVISEREMQRRRPGVPASMFAINGNVMSAIGTTNAVVMADSLANSLGLAVDDTFFIRNFSGNREASLIATITGQQSGTASDVIFADIAGAQHLLSLPGRLDSIDLQLDDTEARQVRNWLPANLVLVEAQARNDNVRQMSEAFHINLLAMTLLSLLVAALLIYNTVTLSVIQRRQALGIFRAQGVTRRQVLSLVLLENAAMGFVASILGVAAGYLLGRFLVTLVTGTVDELYFDLSTTAFFVDPWVLAKGLLLGVALSVVSALLPAIVAAASKPVTLQHKTQSEDWRSRIMWLALAGAMFLLAGFSLLLPDYGSLVTGFIALTLMVFGFCLLVPLCLYGLLSLLLVIGADRIRLSGIMAIRDARLAINRTGLAVAALCVAVSVTVGVGVMVSSFRGTVILWLEQSLPGAFQLTAVSGPALTQGVPASMRQALSALAGITDIHDSVLVQVEADFGPVRLGVNPIPAEEKFYMVNVTDQGYERFNAGEGVFISEPLSYLQTIALGDSVSLLTDRGMTAFPVLGIFHDYTSGSGLVHMPDSLYRQYWNRSRFSRLTLSAAPDADHGLLQAAIEKIMAADASRYTLISNQQLRALTLQIFDRTFAITGVLRVLAILVAFVGVLSTLMAQQLEKGRELAILRANGMTPVQTAVLIFTQTTVLGICAGLLALPLGLLMSDVLIDVINRRSFGWTMQHFLPQSILAEGFLLAVFAAILAGTYPAWRAGRIRPAIALREE